MPGFKETMDEFEKGTLRSSSGEKVTSKEQAFAIAMSQKKDKKYPNNNDPEEYGFSYK
jgi:hypothetical protein